MRIRIQTGSVTPIYRQIAEQVKAAVLRAQLAEGDRLPSIRELAHELEVNPTTVVKAYDLLEAEGFLVRRQGQGAFASTAHPRLPLRERRKELARLCRELAIEARRLGFDEERIREQIAEELDSLRPPEREGRRARS